MQTRSIRHSKFAIPFSVAMLTLTACSGSDSGGSASTTPSTTDNITDNITDNSTSIDWTGRACESPSFKNTLGTYKGELQYQDTAARSCRWSAEIVITGTNEAATETCNVSGNIKVTLIEQGTQLDNTPYICAEMSQATGFATGPSQGLDLSITAPNSYIIQLNETPNEVDENGIALVYAITQFESLTVGGGSLISDTGTIPRVN